MKDRSCCGMDRRECTLLASVLTNTFDVIQTTFAIRSLSTFVRPVSLSAVIEYSFHQRTKTEDSLGSVLGEMQRPGFCWPTPFVLIVS